MLIPWRYRLVIFTVKVAVCCTFLGLLGGCEIGQTLGNDPKPLIGFGVGSPDEAAMSSLLGTVGSLIGGKPGAAIGTGLATLAFGLWRGQRQGWDEHARERSGTPVVVGPVPSVAGNPLPTAPGVIA